MTCIKVKFRPSKSENKEGTIYYQIIHNRVIRQLKTNYPLFMPEWNERKDESNNVIITTNSSREYYPKSIENHIDWDIKRLQSIINQLENKRKRYTADDIISTFRKQSNEQSLFNFMQGVIARFQQMGKQRTSETYRCTLKSFMQFREDKDVLLADIDSDCSKKGRYNPKLAHTMALERRERISRNSCVDESLLKESLRLLCTEQWSPKQISGYMAKRGKKNCKKS